MLSWPSGEPQPDSAEWMLRKQRHIESLEERRERARQTKQKRAEDAVAHDLAVEQMIARNVEERGG
jgi:hypothetical protein